MSDVSQIRTREAGRTVTPPSPKAGDDILRDAADFSLVLGGPLFAWLPLLILSALEGHLLGYGVAVPFFLDLEVHIRFLVAVPLLIIAELIVHRRMRPIAQSFLQRNLIPEAALLRFERAVTSAFRLRNSALAEALLIIFVYVVGVLVIWHQYIALSAATWYGAPSAGGTKLSAAGLWYGYVSLPIFQFLLVRWYFRLLIWTRFLWHVSRIRLSLIPTHPDRLCGLGFLPNTAYAFVVLIVAHGALASAQIANRIFFLGARLPDFKFEIASLLFFLLCVVFGPLLVFSSQLADAKRTGLREYGTLAQRYVREFDFKWLRGGAPADEPFVGSGDIQSLADLSNSFEVVREIRIVPVTGNALLQLAAAMLAPILPLALTMMPLEELLKRLFDILF